MIRRAVRNTPARRISIPLPETQVSSVHSMIPLGWPIRTRRVPGVHSPPIAAATSDPGTAAAAAVAIAPVTA